MRTVALLLIGSAVWGQSGAVLRSRYSEQDFPLTADPSAAVWRGVDPVIADRDPFGKPLPRYRTEIRSRWTDRNVYFLFVCPYEELHLKPDPRTKTETNHLWEFDVAEVFVSSDFEHIGRYQEFEMSPQGEWVDLDIDRDHPLPEGGWQWNSGMEVRSRIDRNAHVWYGEMRIPIQAIDRRRPASGNELRLNLYRCQGSGPDRKYITWQPTGSPSFHVPAAFGRMRLEGK